MQLEETEFSPLPGEMSRSGRGVVNQIDKDFIGLTYMEWPLAEKGGR
jgi:hypothetical protein